MRGSRQNTHRSFALNTFQEELPVDSFRGIYQVETLLLLTERGRHSSLLLPGRDIDRTTALIPTDGGEQYLQQHTATLSRPEGDGSSSVRVQRAQTFCRAVSWGL